VVHVADDAIYTGRSLHTIPHRIRVRQVIFELRKLRLDHFSYADVGCGGGSITHRIVDAIRPAKVSAFDANAELIDTAQELFPEISFRVWDLTRRRSLGETFDLVTCLETLEHIEDLPSALNNLLDITARILFISVPIELGLLGAAKFATKLVLGRKPLGQEHAGSPGMYLRTVLTGGDVSLFRVRSDAGHWVSHTGFDYRKIDAFLVSRGVSFVATNRGWNRFYCIAAREHGRD
jgi:SAM-dependent methyltransferase